MKNEIKKILEITETADYKRLSVDEIIVIKDYITNLQQENKDLKDELEVINKSACFWEDTSDNYQTRMNNYKSRIDKAIEYIKWNYNYNRLSKVFNDKILEILQGSDK